MRQFSIGTIVYFPEPVSGYFPDWRQTGRKLERDVLCSLDKQDHFDATTGFTCWYSGFFHSSL
jgi:hypothetical protein